MSALRHLLAPPEIPQPTHGRVIRKVNMGARKDSTRSPLHRGNKRVIVPEDDDANVLDIIAAHPLGITSKDVNAITRFRGSRTFEVLTRLRAAGKIRYERNGQVVSWLLA